MHPDVEATWEIIVTEGASSERSFILREGSLVVGASPSCAIAATAHDVAPRHAEFVATLGILQLRVFEGTPHVLLNEAPVRGLVDVPCPAAVQIGSLRIFVKGSAENGPSKTPADSTLRFVHPARTDFAPLTDSENPDVTGRIVHRFADREDNAGLGTASASAEDAPPRNTVLSPERTMAFSMEDLEISNLDKVSVRMDYEVRKEIARGGMGRIFSAEDKSLDRRVALKVSTVGDPARSPQFFREAKILAALAHPNIVPIHNLGMDEAGRPFYSMKLIHGRTLQSIIKQIASGDRESSEVYPRMRLLEIFRKVCDAVSFAHAKGYLHRDLKPDNIMVGEFGEVLVMDWGLAKAIRRPGAETGRPDPEEDEPQTLPYIEGTPQYMSPEQANGMYGGLDERSDIYALGGILYAILMLRPPVIGASLEEVLNKVRNGKTTTMDTPRGTVNRTTPNRDSLRVPEALKAVTFKALAKERERRYTSVAELAGDIEAYIGGFATRAEEAGLARQMVLLVKRNRLASALAGASIVGTLLFTWQLAEKTARLVKSEKIAQTRKDESERNATLAAEKARIAEENEQRARQERARTQVALAEAAEQAQDAEAMQRALMEVPEDLRDRSWQYLSKLVDSAELTIENKAPSAWVAFEANPLDPDVVLTLHEDGSIRRLNLKIGETVDVLKTNHSRRTTDRLRISPDARSVAVTSVRNNRLQVEVLDLQTGELKAGCALPYVGQPTRLQFSANGDTLLAADLYPGQIYLLDVPKNSLRRSWKGTAPGLAYLSKNDTAVMYWPRFNQPEEFDISSGAVTGRTANGGYRNESSTYEHHAFSPDHNTVFELHNGELRHLEIGSGKKLFNERLPAGSIRFSSLSLLANKGLLATLSTVSDGAAVLLVHDSSDGRVLQSHLIAMKKTVAMDWTLVTHPLSKRIVVACGNTLKVWSIPDPMETRVIDAHALSVRDGFWFSRNPTAAHFVASAERLPPAKTYAQLVRIDIEKSQEEKPVNTALLTINEITHPGVHLSVNGDASLVATQFAHQRMVSIWRNQNDTLVETNRFELPGYSAFMEMSPTGRFVWSSSGSIETASGKPLQQVNRKDLLEHPEWIAPVWLGESSVAEVLLQRKKYSENTEILERSIVLWSTKTDDPSAIAPAPEAKALAVSPDGGQIAEAGNDMRVRIRNGTTLAVERTLRVHDGPVISAAWHPALPLLATASEDFSVRIWDLRTDTLLEEFRSTRNTPALRLKWSPDGRFLGVAYQSSSANLKVYEPEACKQTSLRTR